MTWTKEPPIEGEQQPCLHAGVAQNLFPLDAVIAVGFGCAQLTCDNKVVYQEQQDSGNEADMTGAQAEELAAADPEHDWRILLSAPLSELEYQRQGPNQWILIKQGEGFA